MIKDTVIILAVILVLMIIIAVFGGCVRCSNNYTREMYTAGVPAHEAGGGSRRTVPAPLTNNDATTPVPSGGQPFLDVTGTMLGQTGFGDTAATFS
jgi:hypothetical protein